MEKKLDIEVTVQKGDVYQLGNHRLMCGDATKKEDVEKLLNGVKADIILTDPPYGINYLETGDDKNWLSLVEKSINNTPYQENANIVIFQQDAGVFELYNLLSKRFTFRQELIWLKVNSRPRKKLFSDVIENMLWFSAGDDYTFHRLEVKREGFRWLYSTDRSEQLGVDEWKRLGLKETRSIPNVFHYGNATGFKQSNKGGPFDKGDRTIVHPTMKPVGMLSDIILSLTNENDIVIDLFGGSGSTLMACEKTDRKCYIMEIEPYYCQVIINRWEKYTWGKAVKL